MDEDQRKICAKAWDAIDAVDAMQAERQEESFDQRYEREAAEADLFLARCVERRRESEPQERGERDQMSLQAVVVMIDAMETRVRSFAVAAAETLAIEAGKKCGELETEIRKLREELGRIRASITLLEAHKAPADVALDGVVPMRGRNNAA